VVNAIERHCTPAIINSGQGRQSTSNEYTALVQMHGIRQSMDGKARCIDKEAIERWYRSLKVGHVYIAGYRSSPGIAARDQAVCQRIQLRLPAPELEIQAALPSVDASNEMSAVLIGMWKEKRFVHPDKP